MCMQLNLSLLLVFGIFGIFVLLRFVFEYSYYFHVFLFFFILLLFSCFTMLRLNCIPFSIVLLLV